MLLVSVPAVFFASSDRSALFVGSAIIAAVLLHLSYVFTRATRRKALQLGRLAKFPEDMVLKASNSVYPPFGMRFGRSIYWLCNHCRTVNKPDTALCSAVGAIVPRWETLLEIGFHCFYFLHSPLRLDCGL